MGMVGSCGGQPGSELRQDPVALKILGPSGSPSSSTGSSHKLRPPILPAFFPVKQRLVVSYRKQLLSRRRTLV